MTIFDIHSHLLPHIDDGKLTFSNFDQMMKKYKENGFSGIVFTPHLHDPFVETNILKINETFERCKEIANENGLEAVLGSEFYISEKVGNLAIPSFGEYVLCEFDPYKFYSEGMNKVEKLFDLGYKVILAHVERYEWLEFKSPLFGAFLQMGCLIQVNAATCDSLKAKAYIENGVVDFLASDNHGNFEYPALLKSKLEENPEILNKMSNFALNVRR